MTASGAGLHPIQLQASLHETIWGGQNLARFAGKSLPPGIKIGESWETEIGNQAINPPYQGRLLSELVEQLGEALLGSQTIAIFGSRFPLLAKFMDAQDKLSLQVHPPAAKAAQLGGEPKTEMWYIAEAAPGAELFVGLKRGVTRADFERRVRDGTVAECFQRLPVRAGDTMFLPSGRVHAIGAGLLIFEIQQNSDTTYRVFDWNRVGLDGRPRPLHVAESLASIDFNDFEPGLVRSDFTQQGAVEVRPLVQDPLFTVQACRLAAGATLALPPNRMKILGVLSGQLQVRDGRNCVRLSPGQFCLVPASLAQAALLAESPTSYLETAAG